MGQAIAYDKPVKNLIDQLSATGHVTHVNYQKKSVTLHHNGGRLSHEGVLNVWKTRPASAHFDVDASGNVAQYVKVTEFAWATGSSQGNRESISIEMCDATLAPNWVVGDATLNSAERLAGWLFAHVIHARPSSSNFFPHQHWSATGCPGPYVMKNWSHILLGAQHWYDVFMGHTAPAPVRKSIDTIAHEVIAGKWGNGPTRTARLKAAGYDPVAVQNRVNYILSH